MDSTKVSRRSSQEISAIRLRDEIMPLRPLVPEGDAAGFKKAAELALLVGTFDGGW